MSVNVSSYEPLAIEERLPESLKVPSLTASSVISDRRRIRVVPQGQQSINNQSSNQITFMLTDSASYLDPQSACFSGKFTITNGTNTQYAILDDGIHSLFSRARLYVGGQLVEDRNNLGVSVNKEIYSSMPWEHYKSVGLPLALLYKYNNDAFATTLGANVDLAGVSQALTSTMKNECDARVANVYAYQSGGACFFSLPLAYIFGLFRTARAIPLRNLGQIQITLDIAPPGQSFYVKPVSGTQPGNPTWTIENMTIEADYLQADARYVAVMDSLMADPTMPGWRLPIRTFQVLQASYSGAGQKTIILSKATRNARQLLFVSQDTTSITNIQAPSTSLFTSQNFTNFYCQIGAQRFPQDPVEGRSRCFALLMDAQHALNNVLATPVVDGCNFQGGFATTDATSSLFILGVSFDKLRGEMVDVDGIDTASSGSQIAIYLNNAPVNPQTLTASIEFTELITCQANRVLVS
jgi:hypothetical protein